MLRYCQQNYEPVLEMVYYLSHCDIAYQILTHSLMSIGRGFQHKRIPRILPDRQATLDSAFAQTPERFGHRRPQVARLPEMVWINRPAQPVCEAAA